ncbi:hypothetical protein [Dokdonella immobilis]|uniref:Dolichyl-phosphate-mannose-protein mannosyltransferase n=1 Tax=Dokdonella immobilis TaxID=578942 RepID=A0A1I4WJL2_9GAMM|nr:hypothetical protein [Dokdonella immobilis]SFN13625.1 hypothetical protein SAMN05216289_10567 [Dokdonella immobilis]
MSTSYLLAWLLPWAAGSGICLALNRGLRRPGDLAAALGSGFVLGLFVAAGLASVVAAERTAEAFARTAPWLAAVGLIAWVAAFVFRDREKAFVPAGAIGVGWRIAWFLVLAAILLRLGLLASEALLRPTFPWDAWSAWAVKPKAWFLLGHHVPYVPIQQWLAEPGVAERTSAIWDYPELLAWIEIWFASAIGSWNEPLINVVWTGVLGAIGLASYGQWRASGIRPGLAMLLTYALLSLPLIDAHAALAGYADLWLAAAFGLAVLGWLRWMRHREGGQLALAWIFALAMPQIKLEGSVWLIAFSLVMLLGVLPKRQRWWLVVAGGAAIALLIAMGGFKVPVLGLGWVHVTWGELVIPALGTLDLHWRSVGAAIVAGLLTLPNWHLLWYLVPVILVLRWPVLARDGTTRSVASLLGLCAAFLFVLFFFTDASAWAENYTSTNRLILHVVPALFTLLALLLADLDPRPRDRVRESPGRISPA